jgi:replication factor A1
MLYTVRGLDENSRGVTIRVRVISRDEVRSVKTKNDNNDHRVVDVRVGDRTGIIMLTLWDDQVEMVDEGDLIDIEQGYVNRFRGRLRLNIGRLGKIEKVDDPSFPSNEELKQRRQREYF